MKQKNKSSRPKKTRAQALEELRRALGTYKLRYIAKHDAGANQKLQTLGKAIDNFTEQDRRWLDRQNELGWTEHEKKDRQLELNRLEQITALLDEGKLDRAVRLFFEFLTNAYGLETVATWALRYYMKLDPWQPKTDAQKVGERLVMAI